MKTVSVLLAFACLTLLLSCTDSPQLPESTKPRQVSGELLTIAILPERNVFEQKRKYRPLADYLSKALGVNVKIKLLDSYGAIYDEIENGTIDGAFFGSYNYILARARTNIEPVARPVDADGKSNYHGIIFTRRDSGLTKHAATWKGKRIALVHEVTTAGYIFPKWYLRQQGIRYFERHFSKVIFAGSHDAAILSVLKGQADIGTAKDTIYRSVLADNPAMQQEMLVLAESMEVPANTLSLRSSLSPETKSALKKELLGMHLTPDGLRVLSGLGATAFKETRDSEYDELREMTKALSVDLSRRSLKEAR